MLRKLIKHDFKAVNRLMLPLHLALIVVTIIGRFYIQFTAYSETGLDYLNTNIWFSVLSASLSALYVIALIAICIITQLYLRVLYPRKNLFTDEGYLTHTLPVSAASHIWSKLIVAFIWSIIDIIMIALSIFAMFINQEMLRGFGELWRELIAAFPDAFGVSVAVGMPAFLIITLLDTISGILLIYMCLAIGHSFNSHKILASIGVYAGYNVIATLISSIWAGITGQQLYGASALLHASYARTTGAYFWSIMGFSAILSIVTGAAAFLLTNYFMKNKLNLE